MYNNFFLKNKVKSFGDKARDFHNNKMSKAGSSYACLAVTLISFVLKKDEKRLLTSVFKRM